MSDNALVFSAKDGLGNRLRSLVGFRTLAEFQQVPLLVHWERDGACDAEFTDLFDSSGWEDIRLIGSDEASSRKANHPERYFYSSVWFTEIWQQYAKSLCSREEFSRVAVKHLRALRPRKDIQSRVEELARTHDLANCIGMHIRMTDNIHAYDWWIKNDPGFVPEKVSRIEGFQATIRELTAQGKRIFVCTDNKIISQELLTTFPVILVYQKEFDDRGFAHYERTHYGTPHRLSRLILRIKAALGIRIPTTWRTTDIADALIEMLLLSRCQQIIGTYYSSFSQVAALIGGIPLHRMEGTAAVENAFVQSILDNLSVHAATATQSPS